jgi:hypothetical protein
MSNCRSAAADCAITDDGAIVTVAAPASNMAARI